MAQPNRARGKKPIRPLSILLLLIMYVVACAAVLVALTPKRYAVTVGAVAPETIHAPRAIEDAGTTEALRDAARNNVQPVYRVDEQSVASINSAAQEYFKGLNQIRTDADKIRLDPLVSWSVALTAEDIATLGSLVNPALTEAQLLAVLNATPAEMLRLEELVLPKVSTAISGGLAEDGVSRMQEACNQEINATTLSAGLKQIGSAVIGEYVKATVAIDAAATEAAREAAASLVEPLTIKQGEVIVEKDTIVTAAQYDVLRELEMVSTGSSDLPLDIGACLFLLLIFAAFGMYLVIFERSIFASGKDMAIITVMVSITLLLALACNAINSRITPGLIAVILTAILVSDRVAVPLSVVIALCIGLIAGGRGSTMLQFESMVMSAASILSGWTAIFALKVSQKRGAVIAAGAVGGGVAAFTILACYLIMGKSFLVILEDIGWALGSDVVAAVLCVGSMSIWEHVFDVATPARLAELSNTNHPLLKQLMSEAPGTYHHSMMVASLAEAAAGRVGADPLLTRVGAYFHDVGKLRRPLYFKENQKPGENIHDTLPPLESAQTIIMHQKDGVTLLAKHKLPSAVIKIAFEHHGTALVSYFYHKAMQEQPNKQIKEKQFRYPGVRPSCKESAIVMLADSCEAAVRSLGDADRTAVEEMVKKVIKGIVDGGQLGASLLTLADLSEIERSFLRTFAGIRHERIEYPDMKKPEKGQNA
ncbi:MAG: HDIG domain-containing protein [Clostridia bacterium]|nr:HDIG domain-containing protein [Clostridia bacterium]